MPPKSIEELRVERGVVKAKITRFNTFWSDFDKESNRIGTLKVHLEKVELQYNEFDRIQTQIELLAVTLPQDLRIREEEERFNFDERFCELVAAAREHIESKTCALTVNRSASNSGLQSPLEANNDIGYKLPRMPLPTFNGSFENWVQFRDSFQAIVHERNIANIDKFHYLNQALTGDAARVIQSLAISDANYEIAWKCLTDRYEDPNALVHNRVQKLCELKSISKDSYLEIRQFIDDINNNLRALKSLGQHTDNWDTLVVYLMSKKLDTNTKREWDKKQASFTELATLQHFLNFLEKQSKILHRSHVEKQSANPNPQSKPNAHNQGKRPAGNLSSHLATEKPPCVICTEPHALYECNKFKELSVLDRGNTIRKFHLCFNCLSAGHGNRTCRSRPCRKCPRRHHTLLHEDKAYETTPSSAQNDASISTFKTTQPEAAKNVTSATLMVGLTESTDKEQEPYVILSTALVYIRDKKGNLHECRALLDNGSQPHLITKDLCRKLDLPVSETKIIVSGVEQVGLNVTEQTSATIKSKI